MTGRHKMLLIALFALLFAGCAQVTGMVIRSMHMDRRYHDQVLPVLIKGYRLKMEGRGPVRSEPAIKLPDFADQA